MGGAIEKIRIAEGNMPGPGLHLLQDIRHHYLDWHDAKFTLIHRHYRAMAAQMFAAAACLNEAEHFFASVRQYQMSVTLQAGQAGAVRRNKFDFGEIDDGFALHFARIAAAQALRQA